MFRTLATALSKRITIPRLSPTHTKCRIVRFEISPPAEVVSYDPIMVVQCSPDLVTEGFRESPDETVQMVVDTQDEGTIASLNDFGGEWIDCGTVIGVIDDGDEIDGPWAWQGYLHAPPEVEK